MDVAGSDATIQPVGKSPKNTAFFAVWRHGENKSKIP
jgi:hypothetical protein